MNGTMINSFSGIKTHQFGLDSLANNIANVMGVFVDSSPLHALSVGEITFSKTQILLSCCSNQLRRLLNPNKNKPEYFFASIFPL